MPILFWLRKLKLKINHCETKLELHHDNYSIEDRVKYLLVEITLNFRPSKTVVFFANARGFRAKDLERVSKTDRDWAFEARDEHAFGASCLPRND